MKYNIPKGLSAIKTLYKTRAFLKDSIGMLEQGFDYFGDTFSLRLGKQLILMTKNADFIDYVLKKNHKNYQKSKPYSDGLARYIGRGLLTVNGNYWLRQRRLIQPQFHRQKIAALLENVNKVAVNFIKKLPTNVEVDITPFMDDFALEVIMNSIFHIEMDKQFINLIKEASHKVQAICDKEAAQPFRKVFYPITGEDKPALKASQKIRESIRTLILERREAKESKDDLLNMLIEAKYEDTNTHMSDDQIIDEIIIFIFAGHETTANTLSWAFYLLAENETVQEETVLDLPALVTPMEIAKDANLTSMINEVMRLFPAAWITDREALNDDRFGDYSFPKGTIIAPFFFGCHRRQEYWKNANQFTPSRFIGEDNKVLKMNNFYPFGAGPRMCIGNNLAMAEMSLFLQALLQTYRIKPSTHAPAKCPSITLAPDKVLIKLERRKLHHS